MQGPELEQLVQRFLEPGELSPEDQSLLNNLLSSKEGRALWVAELDFQAQLVDALKTEGATQVRADDRLGASQIQDISRPSNPQPQLPKMIRFSGWLAMAAMLMVAFFMSYYINGLPKRVDHTVLGKIIAVHGTVHLARGPINVHLLEGMNFKEGDKLLSAIDGSVVFQYKDGSLLSLGSDARLAFATQKQQKRDGWDVGLDKGALDADISPQLRDLRFRTRDLGVQVLGTHFSLTTDKVSEAVHLYDGQLRVVANSSQGDYKINQGTSLLHNTEFQETNVKDADHEQSYELTVKVIKPSGLIEVEGGPFKMLRLPELAQHKKLNQEGPLNLNANLKIGDIIKVKTIGLACPQILEIKP